MYLFNNELAKMIAKLKGTLDEVLGDRIIIDVGGICFQVYVSLRSAERLGDVGSRVELNVIHLFKQDSQMLCGFVDIEEKHIFEALTKVHGIGTKAALAILSTLSAQEFAIAIATGDAKMLAKAPGLGMKGAQRIVLELKDKNIVKLKEENPINDDNINDAILGLISLGYQKSKIVTVVNDVARTIGHASSSDIIIESLKKL